MVQFNAGYSTRPPQDLGIGMVFLGYLNPETWQNVQGYRPKTTQMLVLEM
jgi:hypothetical protein